MFKYNAKGNLSALLVRKLLKGECPCFYDDKPEYYTDGDKVYIKIAYIKYPTHLYEVNNASRLQVCKWYKFLPRAKNEFEALILNRIVDRYHELGGYTVEISKEIGVGLRIDWSI